MKIAMFTNTYSPHIGGVARSVKALAGGLREIGHEVLVVAPEFPGSRKSDAEIMRMSAVQDFTGSDFALPSPFSWTLSNRLEEFAPDIIHSHHPFLLGGTALRMAATRKLPIIYTNHTRYDLYSHYIMQNSDIMKRLALSLTTGYCDLCDHVIAPSGSTAKFLTAQSVTAPITVIPTGVNIKQPDHFDIALERRRLGICENAFVVGHVGRLAQEKNLPYLAKALVGFLLQKMDAHAVIVGDGAMVGAMAKIFTDAGVQERVHMTGALRGEALANAYAILDVFAFSSKSETQGLVLIEAMAAGVPIVALDADGVRDVVEDGKNGFLLMRDSGPTEFAARLTSLALLDKPDLKKLCNAASGTSKMYGQDSTVQKTLDLYRRAIAEHSTDKKRETGLLQATTNSLATQWSILGNIANAVGDALLNSGDDHA